MDSCCISSILLNYSLFLCFIYNYVVFFFFCLCIYIQINRDGQIEINHVKILTDFEKNIKFSFFFETTKKKLAPNRIYMLFVFHFNGFQFLATFLFTLFKTQHYTVLYIVYVCMYVYYIIYFMSLFSFFPTISMHHIILFLVLYSLLLTFFVHFSPAPIVSIFLHIISLNL